MPSFLCKLLICSLSLSLTFASNADKGSSRSKKSGSKAIARANATLCCCPPDNCDGYFFHIHLILQLLNLNFYLYQIYLCFYFLVQRLCFYIHSYLEIVHMIGKQYQSFYFQVVS
ncbi:hypothetical protein QQO_3574 [Clostridioides difficile P3]|nr:hypothetical protein QQO_3574 [Clostridioides difficile P3]